MRFREVQGWDPNDTYMGRLLKDWVAKIPVPKDVKSQVLLQSAFYAPSSRIELSAGRLAISRALIKVKTTIQFIASGPGPTIFSPWEGTHRISYENPDFDLSLARLPLQYAHAPLLGIF